jgi:23S rRNA (adenine-N6)-dimethyltransferase
VSGRAPAAPNPAGAHFLRDHSLIGRLVGASGAGAGDLVLDLGAGRGAITAALAGAGSRVIAVELDPRLAAGLRRRFAAEPLVRVVEADLRRFRLPRREFLAVACLAAGQWHELAMLLAAGQPSERDQAGPISR